MLGAATFPQVDTTNDKQEKRKPSYPLTKRETDNKKSAHPKAAAAAAESHIQRRRHNCNDNPTAAPQQQPHVELLWPFLTCAR
jgi:hypothetical protein